jgi:hypothetical protein
MPTPWLRQPEPARASQASSRLWPLLLPILALVVVAGCAEPGTQTLKADPAPISIPSATVTVGPNDDGRTVDLKVGDRLIVELHAAKQPLRFPPAWTLRSPPSMVLKRVPGDSTPTRVVLVAEAPGTVRLVLVKRQGCGPPLRCPLVADPSGQRERMHPPLSPWVVTITVRVQ